MNIYKIAQEAGVSIATVSRVLNNKPGVRDETRACVEAALRQNKYTPSAIARGLVSKTTNTVGIMTADIRVPRYASLVFYVERELYKMDYNVILCNTGGMGISDTSIKYLNMLAERGASGVVLVGPVLTLNELPKIPFISINAPLQAQNACSVQVNYDHGMALCLGHLREKSRAGILYVQDTETFSGNMKAEAFLKNAPLYGVDADSSCVFKANQGFEGGKQVADQIIKRGKPFSAIIFGDDAAAAGGMARLQQLGRKIPGDVAVIGWNNTLFSQTASPQITTVDDKAEVIGIFAAKLLENILERKQTTPSISLDPDLIIREST